MPNNLPVNQSTVDLLSLQVTTLVQQNQALGNELDAMECRILGMTVISAFLVAWVAYLVFWC